MLVPFLKQDNSKIVGVSNDNNYIFDPKSINTGLFRNEKSTVENTLYDIIIPDSNDIISFVKNIEMLRGALTGLKCDNLIDDVVTPIMSLELFDNLSIRFGYKSGWTKVDGDL